MSGKQHQLSKSLFIRGLQYHKSLYLQKYRPELKEEVTPEKQRLFDSGSNVGMLAQQLFPGGVNDWQRKRWARIYRDLYVMTPQFLD